MHDAQGDDEVQQLSFESLVAQTICRRLPL